MLPIASSAESFTEEERQRLSPYFTNLDGHVFALTNLPETVKAALFARYSRSAKSLRRLFLDEFADKVADGGAGGAAVGLARAERLFDKVFNEYGDDSVAQLGGAHIACEYVSNVLTKVLEWGRLMAYLEQSTRYVPYTDKLHGRWRYHVPAELGDGGLRDRYVEAMDRAFERYAAWIGPMQEYFARRYPKSASDSDAVHRAAIRAKALDTLRGLLPAATQSNLGIYGTGQAFEALLLRMRANPLAEVRACAGEMLTELRKVIPAFLVRVDQPDRGGAWTAYLAESRQRIAGAASVFVDDVLPEPRPEVTLTDFDPDGELKIVAAALYAVSDLPDDQLMEIARRMTADERVAMLQAYAGPRTNRRHRPGRAFERTAYRFDVLTDYGAFRDLQRHRLLTLEWQPLGTRHGFIEPEAISEAGAGDDWAPRDGRLRRAVRNADERGPERRGAVRGRDGVPRAVLHGDERARSDARDRAAHRAAGTSGLPPRVPADAHAHRGGRGARRGRSRDAVRGSLRGGARAARIRARARAEARYSALTSSPLQ